jgi:hypothetical protein
LMIEMDDSTHADIPTLIIAVPRPITGTVPPMVVPLMPLMVVTWQTKRPLATLSSML